MAQRGGVRSEEARAADVGRLWIGEAAGEADGPEFVDPEMERLQGRASIVFLVRAFELESPGIGYAPLESQTKRWANESPIEGSFPTPSGERSGWNVVRKEPLEQRRDDPTPPWAEHRSGTVETADAGWQDSTAQRVTGVCLDILPHRAP